MISLTYIGLIDLCVLCVSVVPSTPSPAGLYLRMVGYALLTHPTGFKPFLPRDGLIYPTVGLTDSGINPHR
ncbi:MAG: hypothetical protein EWV52_03365 [Microcystis panniformis Mp_MB_F_20051200_S6D]|nr:MAG: hypothetical protein EWV52_03365 [Microcystis panniformis Mp_MB_F_20051200_S6D]